MPPTRCYHRHRPPESQLQGSTALDDPKTTPPPPPPPGSTGRGRSPRGLRDQIGATREAAKTLLLAHVELGKAEAASIAREVGRVVAYGAIAFVLVLFALILLGVGAWLSIDEWLLGSMGWGVIHGFLTSLSFALALVLMAFGVSPRRIGRSLLVALVVGVLIAIALGLDLPNRLYVEIGERAALGVEPGVRPLIVGLLVGALIGLIAGLIAAARMHTSGGGRVAALIGLVILGIVVGAITAVTFGPQVGVGIGLTVGLVTWMALMGVDVARTGVDIETLKQRFYPAQTIDTSKETLEWLQKRMPPGIGS